MKNKFFIVSLILVIVAISIITSQLYWIYNMYKSYERELIFDINQSLEKAVYQEMSKRGEIGGGFTAFPLYTEKGDSSKLIEKTIISDDTTFTVKIDPKDFNANYKIVQTVLKDIIPPDVMVINEYFLQEMKNSLFSVHEAYVEYYNLTNNTLLKSSEENQRFTSYISSDMMKIDILERMGIIAHVKNPIWAILGGMLFQLILSIVLIIIAFIGLLYLKSTIFRQWKEEKMRQNSVNAMTHEFRRPIATAIALVSRIPNYIEKENFSKTLQYADYAIEELNKLTSYTTRIQQISNNDKSTISINKSAIEIRPFMDFLIKKYQKKEGEQNKDNNKDTAAINLDISPECTVIHADRLHFANVLDNLIENAIKYSGEKTVIDISLGFKNGYLSISVKDNGIGISSSDIKHIFEKYYRVDHRSVSGKAGFGLGLTYVKSIIEEHGGSIEAKSRGKGHGSEFLLYMPQ